VSKKIKILTPRIYEHSDFFHNAIDFAREHSLNTNELCLELSHYLVDNFDKVWKIEKPRVYKRVADLEAKLAESEETINNLEQQCLICNKDKENEQLKQQLAEKDRELAKYKTQMVLAPKPIDKNLKKLYNCDAVVITEPIVINHDKISFAVDKLEKVKEFCDNPKYQVDYEYYTNCWTTAIDKDSLLNEIDNQIEELKKEMK
jgi:hypothetical protein